MDDTLKYLILNWINMPVEVPKDINEWGTLATIEWFDKMDDIIQNSLPSEPYCMDCLSTDVSHRTYGKSERDRASEDDGYYCDACGSGMVEG